MTDIFWDGKKLAKLEIHQAGKDSEFVWLRGTLENGETVETMYLKEW
jgi:hypothetical protein